ARRRSERRSRVAEAVADAANGQQVLRLARVALELLAEVAHVDVDRARLPIGGIAPERPEQHLAAEDAAGARDEGAQELEFDVGELHRLAGDLDRPARWIDAKLARDQDLTVRPRTARRGGA